jgi:hypothetical protein
MSLSIVVLSSFFLCSEQSSLVKQRDCVLELLGGYQPDMHLQDEVEKVPDESGHGWVTPYFRTKASCEAVAARQRLVGAQADRDVISKGADQALRFKHWQCNLVPVND